MISQVRTLLPCILLLILIPSMNPLYAQSFINITDDSGLTHYYGDGSGGGVSFYDFNGDGWDDLTFASSYNDPIHFYENQEGVLVRKSLLGIDNIYNSKHIIWVDFDNDGDPDLWVTSFYQNFLYRNIGDLIFEEVTELINLPLSFEPTYGAAWGDFDRDGWLDLYVTDKKTGANFKKVSNHLYRNINGEFFEEVTTQTNSADSAKAPFCAAFLDINNDGWQDLYIAQDRIQGNSMLKNTGNGYYQDLSSASGTDLKMNAMCVTVADYNNDEYPDIYVTNTPEGNALFKNNRDETFAEVAAETGVGFYEIGWGSSFLDYDNDGFQDLFVCNMFGSNKFYHNQNGESFEEEEEWFDNEAISYSSATGDLNNDGYPDLVVNNADEFLSTLWLNQSNSENNWIKIKLQGTYSNREGIGARIITYSNGHAFTRFVHAGIGYLSQNSQNTLVGIGEEEIIDSVKIFWPSGIIDTHYSIQPNQQILLTESESLSTPPLLSMSGSYTSCDTDKFSLNAGVFSDRLTYTWSNGEQGITLQPQVSGEYFVQIQDLQGRTFNSDTLILEVMHGPGITDLIVNNSNCHASADGSISFKIIGGSPPYQTNWNAGNPYFRLDSLSSGTYEVFITDSNGCVFETVFKLNDPEPLTVTAEREHDIDDTAIGYIKLSVEGGTPPYSYHWTDHPEEVSETLYDLLSGTYSVMIVDSLGCTIRREFEVYSFFTTSMSTAVTVDSANIILYPNPAKDILYFESPNSAISKIQIFDLSGQLMMEENESDYINIQQLSQGIYIVKVNGHKRKKIIIH